MRVLLIPAKNNYPAPSPDTTSFGQAMPYIAASLKSAGHEVFGLNLNHRWCHGSAPLALETSIRHAIRQYQPELIGVGGLAPDYLFVRDAVQFIRRIAPDIPVVMGGGLVTYDTEFIFGNLKPDFAIKGEGEEAVVLLANALELRKSYSGISGLVYENNGSIRVNELENPPDLDLIPFPEYNLFDFQSYLEKNNHVNNFLVHTRDNPRILPLSTGRSCPYKCTFCCHKQATSFRLRSISNIMDEVSHFYEMYRFNILYIHDELLSATTDRAMEFFLKIGDLKREMNADFDIGCYMRVNDAEENLLAVMKQAGVAFIGYGLESGCDKVLKSMKKGSSTVKIGQAIDLTEKAGIGFHGNFIFGDVAETSETIKETIDFYNKYCKRHTVYFYYITPYPGSEIYDFCESRQLIGDKETYYKTIAFNKGSVNMTRIDDEEFYGLTRPVMNDTFNGYNASIVSVEKTERKTCDNDFPFELRRTFYTIRLVCPHCHGQVSHVYPLRFDRGAQVSFDHSCPDCHRRYFIDLSSWAQALREPDHDFETRFTGEPYSRYYPFISGSFGLPSAPTPVLLESYKTFNIIQYGRVFYAFAQAIGPCDITRLGDDEINAFCKRGLCFIAGSVQESKHKVDTFIN